MIGRRRLIQSLIAKQHSDDEFDLLNKSFWYSIDHSLINMPLLHEKFFELNYDQCTEKFIEQSREISDSLHWQLWYSFGSLFLGMFMSQTSVNGYLGRGSMFLFSFDQLQRLLNYGNTSGHKFLFGLDLGAGDGKITDVLGKFCEKIDVTEASKPMQSRLSNNGFNVIGIDDWLSDDRRYDLISCLNLIDRHPKPISLLHALKKKLVVGEDKKCLLILAVVLPFSQYVEFPESKALGNIPEEQIALNGITFEEQVESFVSKYLIPIGFNVIHWTKLPYLCEGDFEKSFYMLSDAVFVLNSP